MGLNLSTQTNSIINKTITDQSTDFFNSTDMSTTSNLTANQKQDVEFNVGGSIRNCNLTFKQDANIVSKVYSKLDSEKQLDLQRTIEEKLDNQAKSDIMQDISGLPIGASNISDTSQYVENYSFHDLSTRVVNNITNAVNNAIDANQDQMLKVNIGGDFDCSTDGNDILVAQNIDIESIIDNSLKDSNVASIINDFTKEVKNKLETKVSQKIAGLDPFAFIGMIVSVIIVVIVMITVIPLAAKGKLPFQKKGAAFGRRRKRII